MIRVAVVVRSRSVRAALERGLGQRPSLIVVPLPVGGSAPRAAEADVVLVDHHEWSRERATGEGGGPAAIVLAEAPDDALVAAALGDGASGVLPYGAGVAEVSAAIEAAAAGLVVVPASARSAIASRSSRPEPGASLTERRSIGHLGAYGENLRGGDSRQAQRRHASRGRRHRLAARSHHAVV